MGTNENYNKVKSCLLDLIESTVVSVELKVSLLEKTLCSESEYQTLDSLPENINQARMVYKTISCKWSNSQWSAFLCILENTGNFRSIHILRNRGVPSRNVTACGEIHESLTDAELAFVLKYKNVSGSFEGVFRNVERLADTFQSSIDCFGFLKSGQLCFHGDEHKKQKLYSIIKATRRNMNDNKVWWSPRSVPGFISRLRRTIYPSYHATDRSRHTTLLKRALNGDEPLVLLVDDPGMGKTTSLKYLEVDLRRSILEEGRVIVRIDLSEVQSTMSSTLDGLHGLRATEILKILAPHVPSWEDHLQNCKIYLLIDGADDIYPKYDITLKRLIQTLHLLESIRIVITMRPHLRLSFEEEFNTEAWGLSAIDVSEEQVLTRNWLLCNSKWDIFKAMLPKEVTEILKNPQILSVLADFLNEDVKRFGSFPDTVHIFKLMTKLVTRFHLMFLLHKQNMSPGANITQVTLQSMMVRNLPYYYHFANEECGGTENIPISTFPPPEELETELLSYGLLVCRELQIRFVNKCFAKYFYARLLIDREIDELYVKDPFVIMLMRSYFL